MNKKFLVITLAASVIASVSAEEAIAPITSTEVDTTVVTPTETNLQKLEEVTPEEEQAKKTTPAVPAIVEEAVATPSV